MIKIRSQQKPKPSISFPGWPSFEEDEITKTSEILASGKINADDSEEGKLFEQEFAKRIGTNYAVALMNGSVALEAALAALEIGPGDEVITTSRTFIASASCIVMRGAKPVLVDVDPVSQNLDVDCIKNAITAQTKAIIVVHLAGWPCEMEAILKLAEENGLYVIEDCAQAYGARYKDQHVGSFGIIGAFSFCQDKIITTGGEGGMITTNNAILWQKIQALRNHGKSHQCSSPESPNSRFDEDLGTNWRMTEIQAAIGRIQLNKSHQWLRLRKRNADILTHYFQQIRAFRVTIPPEIIYHAYYKYYVFVRPEKLAANWNRDRILRAINDRGVPCYTGVCSEIYLEKAFAKHRLGPIERLPIAKELAETSLMFLVHPTLSEEHMLYKTSIVLEVMKAAMK